LKKSTRWISIGIFALVLLSFTHAYQIEGNSVVLEDAQASLTVTPHTAFYSHYVDKTHRAYKQNFKLCNKTGGDYTVYAAFVFGYSLRSGSVEYWNGSSWVDVTSSFTENHIEHNNKHIYPYTAGKQIDAGECEEFRIEYVPADADETEKWELWLWAGDSWNCILDDSCSKTLKLDPWWDASYSYKRPINSLTTSTDMNAGNVMDLNGIDWSGWNISCADLNDLRVVDETNQEVLDANFFGTDASSDGNVLFTLANDLSANTYNGEFYFYYGDATCAAPGLEDYNAFDTFEDNNTLENPIWNFQATSVEGTFRGSYGATLVDGEDIETTDGVAQAVMEASAWFHSSTTTPTYFTFQLLTGASDSLGEIQLTGGALKYRHSAGYVAFSATPDANAWYYIVVNYKGATVDYYWYDAQRTLIESALGKTPDDTGSVGKVRFVTDGTVVGYVDDVFITHVEIPIGFTVGDEEVSVGVVADATYTETQALEGSKTIVNLDMNNTSLYSSTTATTHEWYLDGSLISTDENVESFDLNYCGSYDFALRAFAEDVNATPYDDDYNFTVTLPCGHLQMHFTDENAMMAITPTVQLNGSNQALTASLLNYDMNNADDIDINVSAWMTNYYQREWHWDDLNQFAQVDINAVLLPTSLGKNTDFQFWDEDGTTKLANSFVDVWTGGSVFGDANTTTRLQLNAQGQTTMFLDNNALDLNYMFVVTEPDETTHYYHTTRFNVLIPLNERDLIEISPFDLEISDVSSQQWTNQSSVITFYAYPNTEDYYVLDINASDYYPRTYYERIRGGPFDYNVQSYLGGVAYGAFQSVLFTRTQSNAAIPNVTIVSKKNLAGIGMTIVEQKVTDIAGSASFSFIQNDTYYLDLYYQEELVWENAEIRPVYTTYQLYLDSQQFTTPDFNATVFDVNFYPATQYIDTNTTVDLNLDILVENATIQNINILVYFDTNTLYDLNTVSTGFINIPDLSVAGSPSQLPLTIEIILTTTRGETIIRSRSYSINPTSLQKDIYTALTVDLSNLLNLGRHNEHKEVTSLIAVILTIFFVGAIGSKTRVDYAGTGIMSMILLGFFVMANFLLFEIFVIACVITFATILLTRVF